MALQLPGLFTRIIAAMVAPRKTSSDVSRAGAGVLSCVGAGASMLSLARRLRGSCLQRKEERMGTLQRSSHGSSGARTFLTFLSAARLCAVRAFGGSRTVEHTSMTAHKNVRMPSDLNVAVPE